ncbi:cyclodeaminase/cyclohydrolase family protein [Micromonospora sp. B11E3]|uniref:cyclodeaminase/cyclohydrolase family protein n=1 Tax=Micromonospora sp. B11E3 TaxID=3153562 RepID=UPI00325FAA9D
MVDMTDRMLDNWLASVASATPGPGAGAVGAMSIAMGAALAEKAAAVTLTRFKPTEPTVTIHEQILTSAREEALQLRNRAVELADKEAIAFVAVTTAYRLPQRDNAEKAIRAEQLREATLRCVELPPHIAAVAAELVRLVERMVDSVNLHVLGIVATAVTTARAGLESAVDSMRVDVMTMSSHDIGLQPGEADAQLAAADAGITAAEAAIDLVRQRMAAESARSQG